MGHNDLLRGSRIPPLPMAPGLSNPQKALMPKDVVTWLEVSRGVPRSASRHLGQLRIFRQLDVAGHKVEFDSFPDVRAGFLLDFTSRRAAGELGHTAEWSPVSGSCSRTTLNVITTVYGHGRVVAKRGQRQFARLPAGTRGYRIVQAKELSCP